MSLAMVYRLLRSLLTAAGLTLVVTVTVALPATATDEPTEPPECGEYRGVTCQGWFTDDAEIVTDHRRVEEAIERLVARYGNQIAVVVVSDSRGEDPLTFARELGNAWGVGDAQRQDGIVVLVDLDARRTELTTGPGVSVAETRVTGAGNSYFGGGDFEGGLLAIIGSLEQELATDVGDDPSDPPSPDQAPRRSRVPLLGLGALAAVALIGGGAIYQGRRGNRRQHVRDERQALIDNDLADLEPGGHELPRIEEYTLPSPSESSDVATGRLLDALAVIAEAKDPTDGESVRAAWSADLIAVVDRPRLIAETEVPLELRAADERPLLEGAVQQATHDALAVSPTDDALFEVRRQELKSVIDSLRPHRVAAARQRIATAVVNRLATTEVGEVLLSDGGERLLTARGALDEEAPARTSLAELEEAYREAKLKTDRLESLYEELPASTARPAVAAALADVVDDPGSAVARYEKVRLALENEGDALQADGLSVPALAALLLMNNDDEDVADFIDAYQTNRGRGSPPGEAVEYALAGLRTPKEINHVRDEARRLDLPVAITAALLRRRDDGPEVYKELLTELTSHGISGDTAKTIAGLLAISLEPAQAIRRWLAARDALHGLGLKGAYADVAAAFGASDPRGPRMFALAYAAQRQALARSAIDDVDRFAPELAHAGTSRQEDTWTGEPIPRGLTTFDPFTLLFYHWVITRGHHGTFGWEPIYRDRSWSGDRGSWWGGGGRFGGWGGGGGFSGGGGSSWSTGSWGSGGFGGFGGGGGFSGGGGSRW